jgi:putative membrane protein
VGLLLRLLAYAASVWVAVALLEGLRYEGHPAGLLAIALLLAVVNAVVRPILTILSLPLIVLTLGLFLLVVNALALALVIAISGAVGLEFTSDGFGWTLLGALVISLVSWGLESVGGRR